MDLAYFYTEKNKIWKENKMEKNNIKYLIFGIALIAISLELNYNTFYFALSQEGFN